MKTPAKINASRDESGKMLIGLEGTGAGLLMLAGRIASGVLVTVASNEKELAELKNVMAAIISGSTTAQKSGFRIGAAAGAVAAALACST